MFVYIVRSMVLITKPWRNTATAVICKLWSVPVWTKLELLLLDTNEVILVLDVHP